MTSQRVRFALASLLILLPIKGAFAQKHVMFDTLQSRDAELWDTALQIWEWAEPGYQETQSAKLLASLLESAGFRIDQGVAQIPTAFTAEFGKGQPIIGILGEFDALPGLSQVAEPQRKPRQGASYGHGCGHHLFGVASAAAAIAVADRIQAGDLKGTVRFYGCPAEEGGGAKADRP